MRPGRPARTSRAKPPKVAVTMPQMTETTGRQPRRTPFMAPIVAKAPTPRLSPICSSKPSLPPGRFRSPPSDGSTSGHAKKAPSAASAEIVRYSVSTVQKGIRLIMSASRIVPPPTAVTVPTITQPRLSIPAVAAVMLPLIAKMPVPK